MSITSVTEVEAPQHYQSCTDMAVGRYVRWLVEANSPDVEIPPHLLIAGSEQHRPFCQCFHKQLAGVEERLRLARKQQEFDRPHEDIDALKAERDALRSVQS